MTNLHLLIAQEYYKNRCNPKKHHIIYCVDYNTDECEGTCYYAVKMDKIELRELRRVDKDGK